MVLTQDVAMCQQQITIGCVSIYHTIFQICWFYCLQNGKEGILNLKSHMIFHVA